MNSGFIWGILKDKNSRLVIDALEGVDVPKECLLPLKTEDLSSVHLEKIEELRTVEDIQIALRDHESMWIYCPQRRATD